MLLEAIKTVIIVSSVYIWGVLIHELAHWYYFKRNLKRSVNITFNGKSILVGEPKDYEDLGQAQNIAMLQFGIGAGYIIIASFVPLFGAWVWLAMIPYTLHCVPDLQGVYILTKDLKDAVKNETFK